MLLVEHDVEMVQSLVTRLYVLDFGTTHRRRDPPTTCWATQPSARHTSGTSCEPTTDPPVPAVANGAAAARAARRRGELRTVPIALRRVVRRAASGPSWRCSVRTARARPPSCASCCGLLKPTTGHAPLPGRATSPGCAPTSWRGIGIVHAPEGRSVFSSLTVEENLSLTFRQVFGRTRVARARSSAAYDQFPRLGERRRQVAGTLSGGEQRMLSLARVLVHEPKLLITDELSLGLAPVIIDEVYATLATIRDAGHVAADRRAARAPGPHARRRRGRRRQGTGDAVGTRRPSSATSANGCSPPSTASSRRATAPAERSPNGNANGAAPEGGPAARSSVGRLRRRRHGSSSSAISVARARPRGCAGSPSAWRLQSVCPVTFQRLVLEDRLARRRKARRGLTAEHQVEVDVGRLLARALHLVHLHRGRGGRRGVLARRWPRTALETPG